MYYKYIKYAKRLGLNYSHHKKKWQLCDMTEMLANAAQVIMKLYINASGQHAAHLE